MATSLALGALLLGHGTALAAGSSVAACANNALGDGSFVARDQSVPSGPWIVSATATIQDNGMYTCTYPGSVVASASSAWIAIEGPIESNGCTLVCTQNDNIVQVGYIRCRLSIECQTSGIPSSHFDEVVYFYAFGNANDITHLPNPQYIRNAPPEEFGATHVFKVKLVYYGDGTRDWQFFIDGSFAGAYSDMFRTWNRLKVQAADEVWNAGDDLGGVVGAHQLFTGLSWYNGTTHTGISGQPYRGGHCFPWSSWNPMPAPATSFSPWTNNRTTSVC